MLDSPLTHVAELDLTVLVRQLGLDDAGLAARLIDSLPDPLRYSRFDRTMTPAMIHAHYEALDWNTVIVLAASEEGDTVGLAEVYPYRAADYLETEIVLTLAPGSYSIGRPLMARALSHAAAAGAWRSVMLFCPPDPALLRIARSLDGRFDAGEGSIVFNL